MCNHYRKKPEVIDWSVRAVPQTRLAFAPSPDMVEHTYPKYPAPVLIQANGERSLVELKWGIERFIGEGKTKPVTNARNDKLLGRAWKTCTEKRRCLIPAVGYYEPGRGPTGARGEILFTLRNQPMFFFAGLWEGETFTMVTTEPNELVRQYHDRMPVVLQEPEWEQWLGEAPLPLDRLTALCRGLEPGALALEEIPALKIVRPQKPATPPPQPDLFS